MVKIDFKGKTLKVQKGTNLRKALIQAGMSPYNGAAKFLNCHGFGSCGTCAVEVSGKVSSLTRMEKWRLGFPPHKRNTGLRLACQCRVLGDLEISKHPGFWGENVK